MFNLKKKKNNNKDTKNQLCFYTKKKGHKKRYRKILNRFNFEKGLILDYQYDPCRNYPISLVFTNHKKFVFCPYIENTKIGNSFAFKEKDFKTGDFGLLSDIPVNQKICYIFNTESQKITYAKAAGSFALLVSKTKKYSLLKLKSGQFKIFNNNCVGFIGNIGFWKKNTRIKKKAGRSFWLGIRPKVRGVVKNPVDHPHGGGEGKTSGGRLSSTPWGKLTKGVPTVNKARIKFLKNKLIRKYF